MPERVDRVELGRLLRGIKPEDDADEPAEAGRDEDHLGLEQDGPIEAAAEQVTLAPAGRAGLHLVQSRGTPVEVGTVGGAAARKLIADGHTVRAMSRSEKSDAAIRSLGATSRNTVGAM